MAAIAKGPRDTVGKDWEAAAGAAKARPYNEQREDP